MSFIVLVNDHVIEGFCPLDGGSPLDYKEVHYSVIQSVYSVSPQLFRVQKLVSKIDVF